MSETKHIPVLLQEIVERLYLKKGDRVVDATLGGGGHALALLKKVSPGGTVIAFDTDAHAIERFQKRVEREDTLGAQAIADGSLVLVHRNYSALGDTLQHLGGERVAAIIADLGFSSDQIEDPERGFSFRKDGPLDMRLHQESELTAEKIVNEYSQEDIERILRAYGDEPYARRIAQVIVLAREKAPIQRSTALAALVERAYPAAVRAKSSLHPATRTFQALRIAVNHEFEHLERLLSEAVEWLQPKGHLAIITFHSGEDRIVKQFFLSEAKGCVCPKSFPVCLCKKTPRVRILTKKPIIPSAEEIAVNPRARSAKLRIVEKV